MPKKEIHPAQKAFAALSHFSGIIFLVVAFYYLFFNEKETALISGGAAVGMSAAFFMLHDWILFKRISFWNALIISLAFWICLSF